MLDALKISVTQKLNPVRQAKTSEELEAIWRYQYKICVKELGLHDLPALDHDHGWMKLESIDHDKAVVFYTGSIEDIKGSIIVQIYQPGEIPKDIKTELSLDLITNIDTKKIIIVSSLTFEQSSSGKSAATALAYKAYEEAIENDGDIIFFSCLADHLQLYQDLGLRPYGAKNHNTKSFGLLVPLIGLLDINYYQEIHSSLFYIFKRYEEEGKKVKSETGPLLELIYEASASAERNPVVIKNEILLFFEESIEEQSATFNFLSFLPEHVLHKISDSSLLINFESGEPVIQQDLRVQELYFIIRGSVEVRRDEKVIATKKKGDIFGEVGFFRENGKRSASVFTVGQTRLLVIQKSFLMNLVKNHPAEACIFYDAIARVMAENIAKH